MKEYIGIDIGGTFLKYAVIDESMNITKKWKKPSVKFDDKDDFYDYLCEDIAIYHHVNMIGVSAPGVIDENSNVLSHAAENVLIMYGTNVNEEIRRRTNKSVATINDAKAAGYCEFRLGNGKGTAKSIYYLIGTGIGGCVCDENGVIDGRDHIVGEFSYLPVGIDEYGNYIMHTEKASMDALIQQYNALTAEDQKVEYGVEIITRYKNGQKAAIDAIATWIDHICYGFVMLTTLYNPDIICIGGGVSEEKWLIEAIRTRYKQRCTMHFRNDMITTKIDRCLFGNDANLLGAVSFALALDIKTITK